MTVVDSHQHFWDPVELGLPAPPPEAAVLNRAFLPRDLRPEVEKAGVDCTVLVQAYPQTRECNDWMFRYANATEFVAGVVAWADLEDPSMLGKALDKLQKEPKFVGLRHIVEGEPDPDWIVRAAVLESLHELAARDVPYDMLVKPHHLRNVLKVLDAAPEFRMVIDHIAKPDIAAGGSPGWAHDMAAIAQCSRVHCKLSGMITEADRENFRPSDIAPYVEHVTSVFGWDRVMFGSDWPVCLLAGDYARVWHTLNESLPRLTAEQRGMVFGGNAIRFYALNVQRAR